MNNKKKKNKKKIYNHINFNNINYLKKYITEDGKIIPKKITGIKSKLQRKISKSIKIARYLSLIPYISNHKK